MSRSGMPGKINLRHLVCPACRSVKLRLRVRPPLLSRIHPEAIRCDDCERVYPVIHGVPYLGIIRKEDLPSVIEMVALAGLHSLSGAKGDQGDELRRWMDIVEKHVESPEPKRVLAEYGIAAAPPWFDSRRMEEIAFRVVMERVKLLGNSVLDIGAGYGYDSMKLRRAGARVTALEFNPLLSAIGLRTAPQIRWIGGSAYALPFPDEAFDIVVSNSALHHLLDIPRALEEALRVTARKGHIVHLCEPFSDSRLSETARAAQLDAASTVLEGVNEQSPPFDAYLSAYRERSRDLDIRIYTAAVSDGLRDFQTWTREEAAEGLSRRNGTLLALVARKKRRFICPVREIGEPLIDTAALAREMADPDRAVNALASCLPERFIDLPLRTAEHPKFHLLNGWKIDQKCEGHRTAYRRGRLFIGRERWKARYLHVNLLLPFEGGSEEQGIVVRIGGRTIENRRLTRGIWTRLCLPIPRRIPVQRALAVEIGLDPAPGEGAAALIHVRSLELSDRSARRCTEEMAAKTGIEAVCRRLRGKRRTIRVLMGSDSEHGMVIVNRIARFFPVIEMVVPKGQEDLYRPRARVRIRGTFPNPVRDRHTLLRHRIRRPVDVIVAETEVMARTLFRLLPRSQGIRRDLYAVLAGGHARLCDASYRQRSWQDDLETARVLRESGRLEESRIHFQRALAAKEMPEEERAEALLGVGDAARQQQDSSWRRFYARGLQILRRHPPARPLDQYRLASRFQQIGWHDDALALYGRIIAEAREPYLMGGAHYHMGEIHLARRSMRRAHKAFSECLRCEPGHVQARRRMEETRAES